MAVKIRWSEAEMTACAKAYADLWRAEQCGNTLSKESLIDGLLDGELKARTKGSVRMRMSNIAAVMAARERPLLSGFLPLKNIGVPSVALIEGVLLQEGLL